MKWFGERCNFDPETWSDLINNRVNQSSRVKGFSLLNTTHGIYLVISSCKSRLCTSGIFTLYELVETDAYLLRCMSICSEYLIYRFSIVAPINCANSKETEICIAESNCVPEKTDFIAFNYSLFFRLSIVRVFVKVRCRALCALFV